MILRCPRCRRNMRSDADAREYYEAGDRDQPGYVTDACRICAPSEDDIEAAREHALEQAMEEGR